MQQFAVHAWKATLSCVLVLLLAVGGLCLAAEGQTLSPAAETLVNTLDEIYAEGWPSGSRRREALGEELVRLARQATDADMDKRVDAIWWAGELYSDSGNREKALNVLNEAGAELEGKLTASQRVSLLHNQLFIYDEAEEYDKALEAVDKVARRVPVPKARGEAGAATEKEWGAWVELQMVRTGALWDVGRNAEAGTTICEASRVLGELAEQVRQEDRAACLKGGIILVATIACGRQAEKLGDLSAMSATCEQAANAYMASRAGAPDRMAELAFAVGFFGRAIGGGPDEDVKARIVAYAAPFAGEKWFGDAWILGCVSVPCEEDYDIAAASWAGEGPDLPVVEWPEKSALRLALLKLFAEKGWVAGNDERLAAVIFATAKEEYQQGLYGAAAERLAGLIEKWPEYASEHAVQYLLDFVNKEAKEGLPEVKVERLTDAAIGEAALSTDADTAAQAQAEAGAEAAVAAAISAPPAVKEAWQAEGSWSGWDGACARGIRHCVYEAAWKGGKTLIFGERRV
jgi:tetratricopeptide (TPR) repeat protein